ncbi:MAG: hypothetical protein ACRDP6_32065 [Actinoallomurus sp.]
MIDTIDVLTETGSAELRETVRGLRRYWTPRGPEPAVFFTLGAPSYLDLTPNPGSDDYQRHADVSRPVLLDSVGWLYENLAKLLSEYLSAPVDYPDHLGLPGFHIWLAAAVFTKPSAPMHFDLQYRSIGWPPETDLTRHISFTLPLRLPAAGGGLNVWDVSHDQFRHAIAKGWIESVTDLKRFHALHYIPYALGRMVIHSGHLLHQVAPSSSVQPDDERLTLQGHGIWCADRWLLYW